MLKVENIEHSFYTVILFIAKNYGFHRGLSHGVSKIGPTHQIIQSTDLDRYRETLTKIRWIEPKD